MRDRAFQLLERNSFRGRNEVAFTGSSRSALPRSPSHAQARVSALRVTIRARPMGRGRRLAGTGGSIGPRELGSQHVPGRHHPRSAATDHRSRGNRRLGCTRRPRHLHMPGARLRPPRRLTPIVRASRMWSFQWESGLGRRLTFSLRAPVGRLGPGGSSFSLPRSAPGLGGLQRPRHMEMPHRSRMKPRRLPLRHSSGEYTAAALRGWLPPSQG